MEIIEHFHLTFLPSQLSPRRFPLDLQRELMYNFLKQKYQMRFSFLFFFQSSSFLFSFCLKLAWLDFVYIVSSPVCRLLTTLSIVFYSGAFHIYVTSETEPTARLVGQYEGSGSFGELALMYNMPRAATVQVFKTPKLELKSKLIMIGRLTWRQKNKIHVQAMSHGSLWAMDRTTFRRIILKTACRKRKMYETLLETVPMLRALTVILFIFSFQIFGSFVR